MGQQTTPGGLRFPLAALGLWLGLAAGGHAASPASASAPVEGPRIKLATASVAPAEHGQEALLRELAQPPFLPPEVFTDLQYAVPAPIIGGLGVEIE